MKSIDYGHDETDESLLLSPISFNNDNPYMDNTYNIDHVDIMGNMDRIFLKELATDLMEHDTQSVPGDHNINQQIRGENQMMKENNDEIVHGKDCWKAIDYIKPSSQTENNDSICVLGMNDIKIKEFEKEQGTLKILFGEEENKFYLYFISQYEEFSVDNQDRGAGIKCKDLVVNKNVENCLGSYLRLQKLIKDMKDSVSGYKAMVSPYRILHSGVFMEKVRFNYCKTKQESLLLCAFIGYQIYHVCDFVLDYDTFCSNIIDCFHDIKKLEQINAKYSKSWGISFVNVENYRMSFQEGILMKNIIRNSLHDSIRNHDIFTLSWCNKRDLYFEVKDEMILNYVQKEKKQLSRDMGKKVLDQLSFEGRQLYSNLNTKRYMN